MEASSVQDKVARGLGRAALHLGEGYDAYRPTDPWAPITPQSFFLRLNAGFHGEDESWHRSARYGIPVWFGVFDTAYTRPGDYLVGPLGVFFVAAQPPLLSPVCVLTNRVVSVTRADGAGAAGLNAYGGATAETETLLLRGWPASLLGIGGGTGGLLPGDAGGSRSVLLLPALQDVMLRPRDVVTDQEGAAFKILDAEHTLLGWRLSVAAVLI
jgi:hypothetical protein